MVKSQASEHADNCHGGRVMTSWARAGILFAIALPCLLGVGVTSVVARDNSAAPTPGGGVRSESTPIPDDVAQRAPLGSGVTAIEVAASGNIRKDLGEAAGLSIAGSEVASFEFSVNDIAVVTSCPGRGVDVAPTLGYFVVIQISAAVRADLGAGLGGGEELFMPLVAEAFDVVDADGTPRALPTEASWACFDDAVLAPPFVGAGEAASGKVVLDSAVASGTLVYAPGDAAGWEWQFGR